MIRTCPQSSPTKRNGSSLVEVVIAMSLGSVVLSLGIGMLHLLLRSETVMSDSLNRCQTVSQLSRLFRDDIHAARSANIETLAKDKPQAKPLLKLQLGPNHQVQYAALDLAVLRTETQGGKTLQTVKFRFAKGSVIDFSQESDEPARVALVVKSPNLKTSRIRPSQPIGVLRELTIRARLGRDYRFESKSQPHE